MAEWYLLYSRPLPCWVRSHGRSPHLIKLVFSVSLGRRSHGFFSGPGSSFHPCACLLCACMLFGSFTNVWSYLLHNKHLLHILHQLWLPCMRNMLQNKIKAVDGDEEAVNQEMGAIEVEEKVTLISRTTSDCFLLIATKPISRQS